MSKENEILKSEDAEELKRELVVKRGELRKFRFALTQSKVKNVKLGRKLRLEIARILTRINQLAS